jgi:PAS domain S-box-containing protein
MIVAMSRFRVKNNREEDVRRAFLDRPRRVDDQAGFLGMEVFQDETDHAVFYLLTRWSDAPSFRTWHASQAHRASHELIPKGLKLDSEWTEIRVLERVEDEQNREGPGHLTGDWGALIQAHLATSAMVHGVVANREGVILAATPPVERFLGYGPGRLCGQPLWDFLTPESAHELRSRVEAGIRRSELRFPVTFADGDSGGRPLICNLDVQPSAFALLGEPVCAIAIPAAGQHNTQGDGRNE